MIATSAPSYAVVTRRRSKPHLIEMIPIDSADRAYFDPNHAARALCGWRPKLVGGIGPQEGWRWTGVVALESVRYPERVRLCGDCLTVWAHQTAVARRAALAAQEQDQRDQVGPGGGPT